MSKLFYIQDCRAAVGNCVLWWRAAGQGYTCDLKDAGKFTAEEARRYAGDRHTDVARPVEDVDRLAVAHVRVEALRRWDREQGGRQ